jgi:hypothetical protein
MDVGQIVYTTIKFKNKTISKTEKPHTKIRFPMRYKQPDKIKLGNGNFICNLIAVVFESHKSTDYILIKTK